MKAEDVKAYLKTMDGGWVDWENTVDTFKSGDPATEVRGIAVGWMGYTWALQHALDLDCNMFITHEPTYYNHLDTDQDIFRYQSVVAKRKMIEDNKLIILRCHDLWDQVPEIGIPDSWATQLGFEDQVAGEGYFRVYDVSGRTALTVAREVAGKVKEFGQNAVQLIGPEDQRVSRVAIGTGAITPFTNFIDDYHIDLAICTDDGFTYWRDGALSIDMRLPVIVVNHAVSEVYGMKLLADHLAGRFSPLPVHFVPQSCIFQLVQAS